MNENNEIYTEIPVDSVSDNQILDNPTYNTDALPDVPSDSIAGDTEINEETGNDVTALPDYDEEDTVSGSDVRTFFDSGTGDTVSAGDIYNITYETVEEVPIWEKPISDYTVTEGLLLLILILLLVSFFARILKLN